MQQNKNQSGFSLIELLIVVAIIGIIAAIAIPNLMASRRAANESAAIGATRTLTSAEATYQSTVGAGSYGDLAALYTEKLVDQVLAESAIAGNPAKSGYQFAVATVDVNSVTASGFDATAIPVTATGMGATGSRSFGATETGVLYDRVGAAAPTFSASTRETADGTALK